MLRCYGWGRTVKYIFQVFGLPAESAKVIHGIHFTGSFGDQFQDFDCACAAGNDPAFAKFNGVSRIPGTFRQTGYDFVTMAQSPRYAPKSSDRIMEIVREYITEIPMKNKEEK